MTQTKLKVGIAGYGIVGKRRRLFIDQHPALQTVAVCDQHFGGEGILPDGVKYFTHYKELLKESLDVLFICVPNYMASEITASALEKNLHVFCEKPPGRNVADIQKVMSIEKQRPHLKLKYGFNHRYHDSVRDALALIKSGEFGEIINMRGIYGKSTVVPFNGGWRSERKYAGGGILLDQGIHLLDLMQLFCGEFKDVQSYVSNSFWKHDVEDNAYALMKDKRGRIATIHSSATQWQHRFSLDIALEKGFIILSGILSGSKSYGEEALTIGRRNDSGNGTMKEETIRYTEDNSWKLEIDEFADAVAGKGEIGNGRSEEALSVMKLVYRIYAADSQWKSKFQIEDPDQ